MARTRIRERRKSLPEIDATANGETPQRKGSLRGSQYRKVPSLPSSGNTSTSTGMKGFILFPTEINDHPAPYFKSTPIELGKFDDRPWENPPPAKFGDAQKAAVANSVMEDLVNDVVQEELMARGIEVIDEQTFKKQADRDIADYVEDELMAPVLAKETEKMAWDTLEFWIRTYGDDERYKRLPEVDVSTQVAIQAYARGEKPSSKLRFLTWNTLIPHIKKAKQGKGLTQNMALLDLQKNIITKVSMDSLQKSATSTLEGDMKKVDETEKLTCPPRRG